MTAAIVGAAIVGAAISGAVVMGLLLVFGRLRAISRPSLESRVLPYVRDVPTSIGWQPVPLSNRPSSALLALASPWLHTGSVWLERLLGGRESVRRRLERAGSRLSVEEFRASQIGWGMAGFAAALVVGLLGPGRDPQRLVPWLLVCCGAAAAAVLARDARLSSQVKRREEQMLAEFPAVADLLALSVAAGEGPLAAIDRVVHSCRGALPDELGRVLAESRTGVPIATALDALALRSGLSIVSRFAEGFAVAMERGTPLVDVLTAQASDVREAAKRSLLETGARKEITMMIPVVFLILPITLLFAFYPGVVGLDLLAP